MNAFTVPTSNIITIGASAGSIAPSTSHPRLSPHRRRPPCPAFTGPREHRLRPAVDPLYRTAARHHGERAIGVVLSGHMADGTHGLTLIKKAGGRAIVQDPDEADVPTMPLNAKRRARG